jgi:hypothetical protein
MQLPRRDRRMEGQVYKDLPERVRSLPIKQKSFLRRRAKNHLLICPPVFLEVGVSTF